MNTILSIPYTFIGILFINIRVKFFNQFCCSLPKIFNRSEIKKPKPFWAFALNLSVICPLSKIWVVSTGSELLVKG